MFKNVILEFIVILIKDYFSLNKVILESFKVIKTKQKSSIKNPIKLTLPRQTKLIMYILNRYYKLSEFYFMLNN